MPRLCPDPSTVESVAEAYYQSREYWNYRLSMENLNPSPIAPAYQTPVMDAEPGVGLPDLPMEHTQQLCFRTRQPSAIMEPWLTPESPVARATSFSGQSLPSSSHRLPSLSFQTSIPDTYHHYQSQYVPEYPPNMQIVETAPQAHPPHHLHLSEVTQAPPFYNAQGTSFWPASSSFVPQQSITPWTLGQEYLHTRYSEPSLSPYSSPTILNGSPQLSEYCSSPEPYPPVLGGRIPRSQPKTDRVGEDSEELNSGKPYAQLIQECLLQAPGHKMMLRDIYEWFEANTNKPFECNGNGWQNSIRHNLSMNQAFENDKTTITNSRGEPKKATSVWYLTDYALRHGVESTTRYRQKTGSRRSPYSHDRDWKRMCSGSKGGRAARKATHMRRLKAERWPRCTSPETVKPFDHLIRAANALEDCPTSRGSSPSSPTDDYPCTPKDSFSIREYGLDSTARPLCHADSLSFNDLQLHDALSQAGYRPSDGSMWDGSLTSTY